MTIFEEKIGRNRRFESYIQRWGLREDPFGLDLPSPEAFVPHQSEDVRKLKWVLSEGKLAVLSGVLGMGKTTLCEFLVASLKEESLIASDPSKQVVPVFIHGAAYKSTEELLRAIILGLEMDAGKDLASLFELLRRWPQDHQERLAIIIDDISESRADAREVGEFLRVLVDIPGIVLLLNGEPKQMEHFLAVTPALKDRVQVRVELKPMSQAQLRELLELRLKNAGYVGYDGLITENGFEALYKISKGVPRRVLKAASNALHYAAEKDKLIDKRVVKKANKRPFFKRFFAFGRF
jgi:general secretion pathway protein A